MDAQNDCPEYSREPTLEDLVLLCRHLNETGVKYVVIGGFAIILSGYIRTTGDIDLLVEKSIPITYKRKGDLYVKKRY